MMPQQPGRIYPLLLTTLLLLLPRNGVAEGRADDLAQDITAWRGALKVEGQQRISTSPTKRAATYKLDVSKDSRRRGSAIQAATRLEANPAQVFEGVSPVGLDLGGLASVSELAFAHL